MILKKPIVFFDLETTGINVVRDRIVEISTIRIELNGEEKIKTYRINPEMPIPEQSSKIHGIYDQDIKDCPTFSQLIGTIKEIFHGADVGGYNVVKFDLPMLVEEFLRAGVEFDVKNKKIVDAQRIFHLMEPRTLSAAYKFYCEKDLENAHSAEADTLATYEVLKAQLAKYEGVAIKDSNGKEYIPVTNDVDSLHKISFSNQIDFAARMVYNEKGQVIFNFGKHKGKLVKDVLDKEPTYYDWIQNSDFSLDTKQKLKEFKLGLLK